MCSVAEHLRVQLSVLLSWQAHHAVQHVRLAPPPPLSQKAEVRPLCAAICLTLLIHYVSLRHEHCRSATQFQGYMPLSEKAHHALQQVRLAPSWSLSRKAVGRLLCAADGLTLCTHYYIFLRHEQHRSAPAVSLYNILSGKRTSVPCPPACAPCTAAGALPESQIGAILRSQQPHTLGSLHPPVTPTSQISSSIFNTLDILSQHAHHALQHVRLAPPRPLARKAEGGLLFAAISLTLWMCYILLEYQQC